MEVLERTEVSLAQLVKSAELDDATKVLAIELIKAGHTDGTLVLSEHGGEPAMVLVPRPLSKDGSLPDGFMDLNPSERYGSAQDKFIAGALASYSRNAPIPDLQANPAFAQCQMEDYAAVLEDDELAPADVDAAITSLYDQRVAECTASHELFSDGGDYTTTPEYAAEAEYADAAHQAVIDGQAAVQTTGPDVEDATQLPDYPSWDDNSVESISGDKTVINVSTSGDSDYGDY
jgi:hypothetical protein